MPPYLEGIAFRVPTLMGEEVHSWTFHVGQVLGFVFYLLSLVRLSKLKVQVLLLWQMPSGQM